MSERAVPLEIHVHLVDGSVARFLQADAVLARRILDLPRPERLFSQPQLLISGPSAASLIPTAAIVRLDVLSAELGHWGAVRDADFMVESHADEYRQHRSDAAPTLRGLPDEPPPLVLYREIVLSNGERVYSKTSGLPAPGAERAALDHAMMVRHSLDAPLGHRRAEGGLTLLNPAHIARLTMHPGPPEPAAGSWPADLLAD